MAKKKITEMDKKEERDKKRFNTAQLKALEELKENKEKQEELKKKQYALERELGIY